MPSSKRPGRRARQRGPAPASASSPVRYGKTNLGPAEETDHPREVIEAALAHVIHRNKVEIAYARSDLFERRRRLKAVTRAALRLAVV